MRPGLLRTILGAAGLLLSASLFAQTPAAPPKPAPKETEVAVRTAARVVLVEGDVALYDAKKVKRVPKVGDVVNEGDSIVTGADAELHLDMEDGGYISVRPNTKMRITKYVADGESTDSAIFGLLQGGFRSVTGWIGKLGKNNYQVKTQIATVGIRGTDHETYVLPKGSSEGEAGLYDRVYEGGTIIRTDGGQVEVTPNRAGFAGLDRKAKPRELKEIPRFFRPGRFESRFTGKHAAVQSILEKRRADRREVVKRKLEAVKQKQNLNHKDNTKHPLAERVEARKEAQKAKAEAQHDAKKAPAAEERKTAREEAKERREERREQRKEQKDKNKDDDKPGK